MYLLIRLVRLRDSLILCEDAHELVFDPRKDVSKAIKALSDGAHLENENGGEVSISDNMLLHYVVLYDVIYTITSEPKLSHTGAMQYMVTTLMPKFRADHESDARNGSASPYMCQSFQDYIGQTRNRLLDPSRDRQGEQLGVIGVELRRVQDSVRKNVEMMLHRGDGIDKLGDLSSRLREDSLRYRQAAQKINWDLLWQQYGPYGGVGLVTVLFLWWRFFW